MNFDNANTRNLEIHISRQTIEISLISECLKTDSSINIARECMKPSVFGNGQVLD